MSGEYTLGTHTFRSRLITGSGKRRVGAVTAQHVGVIHEPVSVLHYMNVEKELRPSYPKHRANQPERASVRFV